MDDRTRANDRRILVNQLLEKYPDMDAEIAQRTIARSGTVHEQNERFNRSGDKYYPVKIGDIWYIGLGTALGSEEDPVVRGQVNELNRTGLSVSEAIRYVDPDLREPLTDASPRAESTARQRVLRENPLPDLTPLEQTGVATRGSFAQEGVPFEQIETPPNRIPQTSTPIEVPVPEAQAPVEQQSLLPVAQDPVTSDVIPDLVDPITPAPIVQASNSATGNNNPTPRPTAQDVTESRRAAQQAAFAELGVDLNGEIDLARQEQIEQVNQANSLAREDLALAGANAAQNAFERVRPGTAFDNLDALSNATSANFSRANLTNTLAGIRGIGGGKGTGAPSVGDLTSLIRSQRRVEDTLKQNREFLEDDTRLELSARAQVVQDENARRSLIGLAPIDLQDTIDPVVREEGFEANRARAQTAAIIPDAERLLLAGDEAATALVEERVATQILNDEAAATVNSLLSRIDDPLERFRVEFASPALMNRFNEQ